jgi:hypothetical protein
MTRQMTAPSSSKNTQGKACRNLIGRLPDFKGHLLFWPIAIAGAAFDLWSKKAVFDWLPTVIGEKYVIIDGFFQFIQYFAGTKTVSGRHLNCRFFCGDRSFSPERGTSANHPGGAGLFYRRYRR